MGLWKVILSDEVSARLAERKRYYKMEKVEDREIRRIFTEIKSAIVAACQSPNLGKAWRKDTNRYRPIYKGRIILIYTIDKAKSEVFVLDAAPAESNWQANLEWYFRYKE